jgi:hypothetical protein
MPDYVAERDGRRIVVEVRLRLHSGSELDHMLGTLLNASELLGGASPVLVVPQDARAKLSRRDSVRRASSGIQVWTLTEDGSMVDDVYVSQP